MSYHAYSGRFPRFILAPENREYKSIRHCYIFLSDNKSFTSHRLHEAHEDRIAKGSQLSALPSAYEPDGKHERKRRALCEIRAICVRINYLSRKKEVCL